MFFGGLQKPLNTRGGTNKKKMLQQDDELYRPFQVG